MNNESKTGRSRLNLITGQILDCSITVHRSLGPGLLESVYETCLAHELTKRNLNVQRQVELPVIYDGIRLAPGFRADLLVDRSVLLELKAVDKVTSVHEAQLLSYLKLSDFRVGLLINFNVVKLKDGFRRFVNNF